MFAIRIIGPTSSDWYIDENGEQCEAEDRRCFHTAEMADDFLALPWPPNTKRPIPGNTVRKHFRRAGYVIKVVNIEGQ